ncbi:MAG: hypothetical protein RLY31_417 [Bacteroidota bacterium]
MQPLTITLLIAFGISFNSLSAAAQDRRTENLFFITLDGLRWQELFGGADDSLIRDTRFVKDTTALLSRFWTDRPTERRKLLFPWIWSTVAQEGQLIGNRKLGNQANLTNRMWFSYPGYNELLVGYSDPNINSNAKIPNPNVTVLEWVRQQPGFEDKVAAFGSWDVFPYIINEERSGIPVNAGFDKADTEPLSPREVFLNELQDQIPSPWSSVRLDAFTHHFALEHLRKRHPRLVYISYGETDDFAHDSRYDHYLESARRTDDFLQDLWAFCQQDSQYAQRTTFVICTDHGRGDSPKSEWTSHGKIFRGSDAVWMAFIGPDTPALGERSEQAQYWQNQVAKTVAAFLGMSYDPSAESVGEVIPNVFRP